MNVSKINNVSIFTGIAKHSKKENKKVDDSQMSSPMSSKTSRAIRNTALTLALLSGAAGAGNMMTSCTKAESASSSQSNSNANAWVWMWAINGGGSEDKPLPNYNFALADSLINQGLNVGAKLDGPKPGEGKNVMFYAATAYNEYDNEEHQIKYEREGTDDRTLAIVDKITNTYDIENPSTRWVKTLVTDVPGKGIRLKRYTSYITDPNKTPSGNEWNIAYTEEIRSNGARGNTPGKNIIYDADGKMIWQGEIKKSEIPGSVLFGKIALVDGEPVVDEDGNTQITDYHFSNMKMWSKEVTEKQFKQEDSMDDFDGGYLGF